MAIFSSYVKLPEGKIGRGYCPVNQQKKKWESHAESLRNDPKNGACSINLRENLLVRNTRLC